MPYRPPLVPHEVFVADPVDLPVRRPGDPGPSGVTRAEVVGWDARGLSLKGTTNDGQVLTVELSGQRPSEISTTVRVLASEASAAHEHH